MFDGILFDLDGTLWDATPAIRDAWNQAMADCGGPQRPPVTLEEVRACMGLLRRDICARLFPGASEAVWDALSSRQILHLTQALAAGGSILYPQVEETLAALSRNARLFLVSNCGDRYLNAFYDGHGLKKYFFADLCAGRTRRPKADNIAQVVREYGLKAPVYVGDTQLDCDAAHAAGIPFLHAAYGFGAVEGERAADSFAGLPAALAAMCPP